MSKKPWGGRFKGTVAKSAEQFSSSIHYDKRLYKCDITQSIAYAKTLNRAGVISSAELSQITKGLQGILRDIEAGKIKFSAQYEDVHMNIESILTDRIGETGKKLHTGRSRNDQVSTDLRMYVKEEIAQIVTLIVELQKVLLNLADKNIGVIMPGYTHLQKAQPILFSHHMMAYLQMLKRDKERLLDAYKRVDVLTLGSGAISGTNFGLDRKFLAKELGFADISHNSMDAVSDRDFVIETLSAISICQVHISRFAEELIIWSTSEFGYITLSDAYTTGSSLMPQKKNADMAELSRGKSGRIFGSLFSLLTTMKGLPLTYNRDLQEDKEPLFDSIDTIKMELQIFAEMLSTMRINSDKMSQASKVGFLSATDLAYYLVSKGESFRNAHEIVGKIVAQCEGLGIELDALKIVDFQKFSSKISEDVFKVLTPEASISAKNVIGGTAKKMVMEEIKNERKNILHGKA